MNKPTQTEIRQLTCINKLTHPHELVNPERSPWIVTLRSGREIQLIVPLAAAVDVEAKGHMIRWGYVNQH